MPELTEEDGLLRSNPSFSTELWASTGLTDIHHQGHLFGWCLLEMGVPDDQHPADALTVWVLSDIKE